MLRGLLNVRTRDDDPLTFRRGRALALLLLVLVGISIPVMIADGLLSNTLDGAIINLVAILLSLTIYFINRSGRLALAASILLTTFVILPINAGVLVGTPIPAIFFPCLTIVLAAAFGRPRAPLIWAVIATTVPLLINLLLYRSPLPPPGPVILPNGTQAPPLVLFEVLAIFLYWTIAGTSSLAARQLYLTIEESRAATQAAVMAQQELAAQQSDLAARNEQLTQARQELESLVSELTVPVVPVADGIGLLPLVGSLDARRAARVEGDALKIVAGQRMRALVIDLSGVSALRPDNVEGLVRLCATLQLLGVTPVLAGLGPQSALLLSETNIVLPRTAATVQDALALLQNN
jgi:anti-anti-sigma regulatory factor